MGKEPPAARLAENPYPKLQVKHACNSRDGSIDQRWSCDRPARSSPNGISWKFRVRACRPRWRACFACALACGRRKQPFHHPFTHGMRKLCGTSGHAWKNDVNEQAATSNRQCGPRPGRNGRTCRRRQGAGEAQAESFARDFARNLRSVLVLKGATTWIAAPDGSLWIYRSQCPGLGTSGSATCWRESSRASQLAAPARCRPRCGACCCMARRADRFRVRSARWVFLHARLPASCPAFWIARVDGYSDQTT